MNKVLTVLINCLIWNQHASVTLLPSPPRIAASLSCRPCFCCVIRSFSYPVFSLCIALISSVWISLSGLRADPVDSTCLFLVSPGLFLTADSLSAGYGSLLAHVLSCSRVGVQQSEACRCGLTSAPRTPKQKPLASNCVLKPSVSRYSTGTPPPHPQAFLYIPDNLTRAFWP